MNRINFYLNSTSSRRRRSVENSVRLEYIADDDEDVELGGKQQRPQNLDPCPGAKAEFQTYTSLETKAIVILRIVVLGLLLFAAILASVGVYFYTKNDEKTAFEAEFKRNAKRVSESVQNSVERKLVAVNSLATSITSYAIDTNASFPFVTMPHFALIGSDVRVQAESTIIHWMPLITDETRAEWEEYASANRFQIDEAFVEDSKQRNKQDAQFGYQDDDGSNGSGRMLQEENDDGEHSKDDSLRVNGETPQETIMDDGTGFHTKIWSGGSITPKGDEPEKPGHFLPLWQRSPINGAKQSILNLNFASSKIFYPILPAIQATKNAVLSSAEIPLPEFRKKFAANLAIGQYRHLNGEYVDDPLTFMGYPVFDSFKVDDNKPNLAGVIGISFYWRRHFMNILSESAKGIICVFENSYNQTLSYRIDGAQATYLGEGDYHDTIYNHMEVAVNLNAYVHSRAKVDTRSYNTVPLSQEFGEYTLRVYPSTETEDEFSTNKPLVYTVSIFFTFSFTSIVFLVFAFVVERRQHILMDKAVKNAQKVAAVERELNEFIAHEVRNPLSAAMSACTFVSAAINKNESNDNVNNISSPLLSNEEESQRQLQCVREDIQIIDSSLHFINEFLRSMLDIQRATANQLKLNLAPTDILRDIFQPVSNMLYNRDSNFIFLLECPENLVVMADHLRLQQVILNLGRNATKFVDSGFIKFRASILKSGFVELYVEDSGPGIPTEKRTAVFAKYQTSLDVLSQGTGIGLCLCKKLMTLMKGDIWLDESYDSGIEESPGARFVIQLNSKPTVEDDWNFVLKHALKSRTYESKINDGHVENSGKVKPVVLENSSQDRGVVSSSPGTNIINAVTDHRFGEPPMKEDVESKLPENLSILFVDDDRVLRKLFSRAVMKVAPTWNVEEAANGETALELVNSQTYDIIFIDQYMSSVEKQLLGTETVRSLRAKGIQSKLCGLSANDLEKSFIGAGADFFVLKPFPCEKNALRNELQRIIACNLTKR